MLCRIFGKAFFLYSGAAFSIKVVIISLQIVQNFEGFVELLQGKGRRISRTLFVRPADAVPVHLVSAQGANAGFSPKKFPRAGNVKTIIVAALITAFRCFHLLAFAPIPSPEIFAVLPKGPSSSRTARAKRRACTARGGRRCFANARTFRRSRQFCRVFCNIPCSCVRSGAIFGYNNPRSTCSRRIFLSAVVP